jgi:filamentous hemagglutinin
VDISSKNIRVVTNAGADDGSLQLTTANVNALNADSLLLGGKRNLQAGVTQITTIADSVNIENDFNNAIKTPEFIASATNNVTVKSGAAIDTGLASKIPAKTVISTSGDGALLALSSASDFTYNRTGGSAASTLGELNIEAGSTLKAGNSLVVDATKLATLNSNVTLQDGGSATFGANSILIGSAPINVVGLNLNAGALTALGQIKTLTLNSYNNIDTFGTVNFGNDKLDLTMNAAGIAGHLANGEATAPVNAAPSIITANTFTLKNTQNAQITEPVDASGRALEINANTVKFDSGKTEIAGYTKLDVKANEIRVAKLGETSFNVAETKLTTGRLTADTAADYKINTNEKLEIEQLANAVASTNKGFGAKLDISAKDLTVASNIDLSSGKLALTATNDLNIAAGANLSAASTTNTFYDKTLTANAGTVALTSSTANVNVNTGAVVDVTSKGDANAGLVKVVASSGTTNINGDLKGAATGTGKGGVLDVDVKTLADITTTNSKAVGFSEGRQYRVRTGDVNITGTTNNNNALAARDTTVSADTGKITVSGDIIATAPKNSHISLYAGNGVTFESAANLKANSTSAGEEGGKVDVYTTNGSLDLKAGSNIDVSSGVGGTGGSVAFRSPRTGTGAGNGIAVTSLASTITGAKSTVLEAFKVFNGATSINTGSGTGAALGFTAISNDADSFMANKESIVSSLGKAGDATFHLRAGTEVQSATSLTVGATGSDWNLYSTTRAGGEPSVLTLRAKDNITFNGSLSDGFTTATTAGAIGEGDSTSYRIVAGADFTAANPLATIASAKDISGNALTGNVSLANNKLIRTGTGSIDIAAGGDLKMLGTNAVIYTAGRSAADLVGFDLPKNTLKPMYLTSGGDINIVANGNIIGGEPTTGRQLINEWLFRQGGGSSNLAPRFI